MFRAVAYRPSRRVLLGAGVLAVVGLLAVLDACGAPHVGGRGRRRPSILLLTLDTTRADRLGCYGDPDALTPQLDALAATGVRFEAAYTPSPMTLPAHTTLLTGLEPPEHGVRINGRQRLPDGTATAAEQLRTRGYRTGAFISAYVLAKRFGVAVAQDLVPPHPTLGDVDSAQALADYQAAKRAHKAEWMKAKAGA